MHREVLDPQQIYLAQPCGKVPSRLPTAVRNFGFIPEFADLRVGDLLLVAPCKPTYIQKRIIKAQRECFGEDDAKWTHCAVYIGEFLICEAVRAGVRIGSLLDYIPGYCLRFRNPLGCERDECWNIALRALTRLRRPYDYGAFWQLFLALNKGAHRPTIRNSLINAGSAICSQLYADAFQEAIGRVLVTTPSSVAMPGDLDSTPTMQDRLVRWADINRPRNDPALRT